MNTGLYGRLLFAAALTFAVSAQAQRGGMVGPGGGGGGPMQEERKLVGQFDKDKNGWLNTDERKAAREFLSTQPQMGPGARGGPGMGPGGGGFGGPPPQMGPDGR